MQSTQNIDSNGIKIKNGRWAFPIGSFILLLVCLLAIHDEFRHFKMLERLSKNGIVTKATITAKDVIFSKTYNTYFFQYKYHVNNDSTVSDYVASSNVKKYIYNSQTKGDEIEITYNRMNPIESSYGNILNASKREIFMYNWLYYLSLIVFIILLMLITVSMSFDAIRQSKNIGNKLNL